MQQRGALSDGGTPPSSDRITAKNIRAGKVPWIGPDRATEATRDLFTAATRFLRWSTLAGGPMKVGWWRTPTVFWEGAMSWPLLRQLGARPVWVWKADWKGKPPLRHGLPADLAALGWGRFERDERWGLDRLTWELSGATGFYAFVQMISEEHIGTSDWREVLRECSCGRLRNDLDRKVDVGWRSTVITRAACRLYDHGATVEQAAAVIAAMSCYQEKFGQRGDRPPEREASDIWSYWWRRNFAFAEALGA